MLLVTLFAFVYSIAIWIKVGLQIGRPYPAYTFAFWDGGLLFRGKRLDGRGKMIAWAVAMTVLALACLGFTFTTFAKHY